jgi:predicted metal-dependent peptidase
VSISVGRDEKRHWLVATATGVLTRDEITTFIRTARASEELRMWPMLFVANDASTNMTDEDVDQAVAVVARALATTGARAHVAIVTSDDQLYSWMLLYEAKCADIGVRLIRVFRQQDDAERWLQIVSAARNLH